MTDWDDDDNFNGAEDSDLVKQLRKQLKEKSAALKTATEELDGLRPQVRASSLTSILTGLNVTDPRVAELMPKDLDVTKENVEAWLGKYGDMFNIKSGEPESGANEAQQTGQQESVEDQGQNQDWQRFQSQSNSTGATTPDLETQQIALLQRANEASGGNVDLYFSMLRGETPIPS